MSTKINLRPKTKENYDIEDYNFSDTENSLKLKKKPYKKRKTVITSENEIKNTSTSDESVKTIPKIPENETENDSESENILDRLPKSKKSLKNLLQQVEKKIQIYKSQFFKEQYDINNGKKSLIPDNSIPICQDVTKFDFQSLKLAQEKHSGQLFDVIMMDPPWQLSSSQPSRGVAIAYDSLSDEKIQNMPIETLQKDGFIFVWAINAKYRLTCKLIENWGYTLVDEITWVKKTVNGKIAKGHGFYLQHAKESCLIGVKGNVLNNDKFQKNISSDVIFSERRGQSQKPEEIYQLIQELCPKGYYLEIFARRNNLHDNWVSIGNEL
ncbi:mt-a70 family protein, putative [Ichthyophthirius multifiliis]|uniref:mRNA m(6)A methyltransferase n=1 Tax=Ichthyophthirius multifiliis TaxID=5932 RepID=G0QRF2_ICHMU|nr:mt-a70 family protein, putative [Ichthyophthirius multifiliis]EGR32187.1 mt-a70 family protein, putative [Ichthyophthirius multifiliis]|eukprot:XP_004035673.1 mt-a70 family protein, putative [Ichthyophthirius multifiliis]